MSKKKNKAMKVYNGFYDRSFVKIDRGKDFLFDFVNYCNDHGYDLDTSSIESSQKVLKTIDNYIANKTIKQNGIFFPFNIGDITIYNTHDLEIYNKTLDQINKMRK
jgi:hypothetical protein